MPRQATGNTYRSRGVWYARLTVGPKRRRSFALSAVNEAAADERAALLASFAGRLRAAGCAETEQLLELAAEAEGKALADVERAVELVCTRQSRPRTSAETTFREIAAMWTSGVIARLHPDCVKVKGTTKSDRSYLDHHILPVMVTAGNRRRLFGDLAIAEVGVEQAEEVLASLGSHLAQTTRRNIAQCLQRILILAAFPLRLIPTNPLPKGWLPDKGSAKAKGYLYPDEDAQLLACTATALCWRVLYGFLNREGCRLGEARRFNISDVDIERGAITLDENKTDDPRAWPLQPGTVRALRLWLAHRGELAPDAPLFVGADGERLGEGSKYSRNLLRALTRAGVDRPTLFERSATRRPLRAHDTRATFITLALANGRTETWVADRTGHRSSQMINTYRRGARSVAELGLGDLAPLDEAIPELVALARKGAGKGGATPTLRENTENERASMNEVRLSPLDGKASAGGDSRRKRPASPADRAGPKVPAALSEPPAALSRGPREGLLLDAARRLQEAVEAGDLGAARVAHETIGRLLAGAGGGVVVDLADRRRR